MFHKIKNTKINHFQNNSGFGLIELMVSISIIVLVTGVILSRHSKYDGAVLLRSQAYEVALQTREVQLSAVSTVGQSGQFRNVLGLYFDTTTMPNRYLTFRDTVVSSNYFYDTGEQVGKQNNIDPRFTIDKIKVNSSGAPTYPGSISVVFERPNYDAKFYSNTGVISATSVEIDIRLKGSTGTGVGEVRTVEITKTGQIVVK
jgi:prepilin-type N-terminal cleavage/methylation domain-containing protein